MSENIDLKRSIVRERFSAIVMPYVKSLVTPNLQPQLLKLITRRAIIIENAISQLEALRDEI